MSGLSTFIKQHAGISSIINKLRAGRKLGTVSTVIKRRKKKLIRLWNKGGR